VIIDCGTQLSTCDRIQPASPLGSILSSKNIKSDKFSESFRKLKTYHFCLKGQKNFLVEVLAWLAYLLEVLKCSLKLFHINTIGNIGYQF
jgi:hypothetical protein